MGVTYKLKDEVVEFILSQKQGNALASCREIALLVAQKFDLHLSKSSVHGVLKESGVMSSRGRKPKDKFEIPPEKKKQIHQSLTKTGFKSHLPESRQEPPLPKMEISLPELPKNEERILLEAPKEVIETSPEYEGAGNIFIKAALWDLGIYSRSDICDNDWVYYLTYAKGINITLEESQNFFIALPLPIERCIREVADGLVNQIKPFICDRLAQEGLIASVKASQKPVFAKISIVDNEDHILAEFDNIVGQNLIIKSEDRYFVENIEKNPIKRAKALFFPQAIENNNFMEIISHLRGYESKNKTELVITLLTQDMVLDRAILQEGVGRLNKMYIYDDKDRLVKLRI